MYLRRLLLFIILCCCTWQASARYNPRWAGYGVEVNPIYGKVLKHNYIFPPVPKSTYGLDVVLLKQTDGRQDWQQHRHYPLIGLGVTYTNYGIDSVYGEAFGIYPVLELLLVRGMKLEWTCRFGYGIGYISKRFERHPSWDTVNNLIGSHLNNFTMFTTQLRYKASEKLHIHAGFNFTHISNGSFRLPNLGINMYGGHVGMRYFPVTDNPDRKHKHIDLLYNRWMVQARVGIGFVEYNNADGPRYPAYAATLYGSKRYGSRNKVLFGIDYTYYDAVYNFMRNNEIGIGEEHSRSWEGVFFVGHEFLFGRFGVIAQFGIPFRHTEMNKDKTVQKLGYSYYLLQYEDGFLKELTLNSFIKSNNLEAANLEFGLGIGI
jgi:hypothetical protein